MQAQIDRGPVEPGQKPNRSVSHAAAQIFLQRRLRPAPTWSTNSPVVKKTEATSVMTVGGTP
jgi:hypothetical protein